MLSEELQVIVHKSSLTIGMQFSSVALRLKPDTCRQLPVASYLSQVTCRQLPVASCLSPFAFLTPET